MNWFLKALSSSVGRKFVMGLTGLLLCGFLKVHFAGNLLLFVGADAYNQYAHTLHSQEWLIKIAEGGLVILFMAHLYLAYATTSDNRAARKKEYEEKESKQESGTLIYALKPHNWMFFTGSVVLLFLILHLADFALELRPDFDYEGLQPYDKALMILRNPISFTVYCVGTIALCWHLLHGVASAFQSLGINHPKYNKPIKILGTIFAVVFGLGFIMFPLWANGVKDKKPKTEQSQSSEAQKHQKIIKKTSSEH